MSEKPQAQNNPTPIEAPPPPPEARVRSATRLFIWCCAALVVAFLVWARYGKLDIVSQADGEVIPSTRVKRVQHLEGGIIRTILVKEGQEVEAGEKLVELDAVSPTTSVEELRIRINALRVDQARYRAEAEGAETIDFPPDLVEEQPALVEEARRLFRLRRKRLQNEIQAQVQAIEQREQSINEITARMRNTRESLEILRKQISISEELLRDQLTTEYKHLAFLKEESRLKSRLEEDAAKLKRVRAELAEERSELEGLTHAFREEAREELKEASQELDEFSQRLKKFSDSLRRTVVRSPVDGVVKSLYVVNPGEVVKPGETIMDVVPGSDKLVVEAHLAIRDIGYIQKGQRAVVKLASQDANRFGKLEGVVTSISPDAVTDKEGRTYYRVLVETERSFFEKGEARYNLFPGMVVVVGIHTGKRTVLEYMLSPYFTSLGFSLHER
jgi:adhesin transport system membrane fusion protein